MSLSAIINNALADAASQMTTQVLHQAITRLAEKYGFDFAEAIQFINLEPARPEVLKKSDLPWCGVADYTCCAALSFRGGLYTQCHKAHVTDGLCGACYKQKQETGSLKNGSIAERLAASPFEFMDGKVARFTKLMAKNGWTQELVERSAEEYGLTIPPENFVESKPKRGRKVTRPVMETPEPQAIFSSEEVVVEPVEAVEAVDSDSEEVARTPLAEFVTYNATDPDSDDELVEEAPKVEKPKKEKKVKAEGGGDSEKPKKEKKVKAEGGGNSEKPKKEKKVKAEESGSDSEKPKKEKKVKAEESGSDSEKPKKEKSDSGSESEPKKKPLVDYSAITAEEAAGLKPMALRTACAQHNIVIGSKTAETLRAELIAKVAA
jgi:hypothetical protein